MAQARKPGFPTAPDPNARYRVRDKNVPGKPGMVWGENLSLGEAEKLKEIVVGAGKSKTARLEPMTADETNYKTTINGDPTRERLRGEVQKDAYLERMRQHTLGVTTGVAAEAQKRADALAAQKAKIAQIRAVPPPAPELVAHQDDGLPGLDEIEAVVDGMSDDGGLPTEEEFAQAKAEAEAQYAAAFATECPTCHALSGRDCTGDGLNVLGMHDERWLAANPPQPGDPATAQDVVGDDEAVSL